MASNPILKVILQAIDNVSPEAKKAADGVSNFVDSSTKWLKGLSAAAAGFALGSFFKSAGEEALKAEASIRRLSTAVGTTGSDFSAWSDEIDSTIRNVMKMSVATDDDLYESLVRLVTISGNVGKSLDNLGLVTDIASYKNISMSEAADLVAKAMAGNVREFKRMGIAGKDADTVLENARKTFSGFASGEAATLGGSLKQTVNWWGEFKEAVGKAILSSGDAATSTGVLTSAFIAMAEWIEKNEQPIGAIVGIISDVGKVLLEAAATIWDVAGPPLLWLGKYIGGTLLIAFESLVGVIRFSLGNIRLLAGGIVEAIGFLIEHAGSVLKKFGIDVVASSGASIKKYGEEMVQAANAQTKRAISDTQTNIEKLLGVHKTGNAKVEAEGKRSNRDRHVEDKEANAKKLKEEEKAAEALLKAHEEWNKASLKQLEGIGKQLAEMRKKQNAETKEAAEMLAQQLNINLGKVTADALKLTTEAMEKLLDQLRGKIPIEQWIALNESVKQHKRDLSDTLPPMDALAKSAEEAADANERMKNEQKKAAEHAKKLAMQGGDIARAFLQAGEAVGLIDSKMASILNSAVSLATNITKAFGGDPGAIAASVVSLANIIVGLGSSEVEKKRAAAAAANTRAVDRLTREFGNFNLNATGKVFSGVQKAVDAAEAARAAARSKGMSPGDADKEAEKAFNLALAKAGVSTEEARALFKELMGRDLAEANKGTKFADLLALKKAMGVTEFGAYGSDFEGQLAATEKAISLYGLTSDEDKLKEYSKLAEFSPGIMAALKSDDPKKALLALFEKARNGGISTDEAGQLTATQTVSLIETFMSLMSGETGSLASLFGKPAAAAGGIPYLGDSHPFTAGLDIATSPSGNSLNANELTMTFEAGSIVIQSPAPTGDLQYDAKQFADALGSVIDETIADRVAKKQLLLGSAA
jgi:hypothetical protein